MQEEVRAIRARILPVLCMRKRHAHVSARVILGGAWAGGVQHARERGWQEVTKLAHPFPPFRLRDIGGHVQPDLTDWSAPLRIPWDGSDHGVSSCASVFLLPGVDPLE